jgi:hypothetical protein
MKKKSQFPATLFVRWNDNEAYFSADADAAQLLEHGETVTIAEYKLVTTTKARLVPEFKP